VLHKTQKKEETLHPTNTKFCIVAVHSQLFCSKRFVIFSWSPCFRVTCCQGRKREQNWV